MSSHLSRFIPPGWHVFLLWRLFWLVWNLYLWCSPCCLQHHFSDGAALVYLLRQSEELASFAFVIEVNLQIETRLKLTCCTHLDKTLPPKMCSYGRSGTWAFTGTSFSSRNTRLHFYPLKQHPPTLSSLLGYVSSGLFPQNFVPFWEGGLLFFQANQTDTRTHVDKDHLHSLLGDKLVPCI